MHDCLRTCLDQLTWPELATYNRLHALALLHERASIRRYDDQEPLTWGLDRRLRDELDRGNVDVTMRGWLGRPHYALSSQGRSYLDEQVTKLGTAYETAKKVPAAEREEVIRNAGFVPLDYFLRRLILVDKLFNDSFGFFEMGGVGTRLGARFLKAGHRKMTAKTQTENAPPPIHFAVAAPYRRRLFA